MTKKNIAIFIGLLTVAIIFLLPLLQEDNSLNENIQTSTNSSESVNGYPENNVNGRLKKDFESKVQSASRISNEIELAATKSELEQLIVDYNDNLENTEIKQELEIKMVKLIKKYNAQVLPIALDKIQGSNKSGS